MVSGDSVGVVRLGVSDLGLVAPEVSRPFLEAFLCVRICSYVSQRSVLEEHLSKKSTPTSRHSMGHL